MPKQKGTTHARSPSRQQLVMRLLRLLEAEIAASEAAVGKRGRAPDPERTRTLATLARALQTVTVLSKANGSSEDEPDDPAFRSVEELERAISRHLAEMEREATGELPRKARAR